MPLALDGRVALDLRAVAVVLRGIKVEVMHTRLGGDALLGERYVVAEEVCLLLGRDV